MKAVLDSRKDLGIALKNIDDFRIRLLDEPDRSRYESRPCSNVNSMVRGPKKDNAAGGMKNIVEMMSLRLLSRLEQGLPRRLALSFNLKKAVSYILADQASQAMANKNYRSIILWGSTSCKN